MHFDVFNGDADGILALVQLRKAAPKLSTLVTGVKRNINLLEGVRVEKGDEITVLDISMKKNRVALDRLLGNDVRVFYADHHQAGDIPKHKNLEIHVDTSSDICTALIIDRVLDSKYRHWAIAGAYGDNLYAVANRLAKQAHLSPKQREQLERLGTLVNYNSYGEQLEDLIIDPKNLYLELLQFNDPFSAVSEDGASLSILQKAYQQDFEWATQQVADYNTNLLRVFKLPNLNVSRRISGILSNHLANQAPNCAHIVLTQNSNGQYTVSLRAPLNHKFGAGGLCQQFTSGGGREAAAGINHFDIRELPMLIERVERYYRQAF
jgi:hypothetical protein